MTFSNTFSKQCYREIKKDLGLQPRFCFLPPKARNNSKEIIKNYKNFNKENQKLIWQEIECINTSGTPKYQQKTQKLMDMLQPFKPETRIKNLQFISDSQKEELLAGISSVKNAINNSKNSILKYVESLDYKANIKSDLKAFKSIIESEVMKESDEISNKYFTNDIQKLVQKENANSAIHSLSYAIEAHLNDSNPSNKESVKDAVNKGCNEVLIIFDQYVKRILI